MAYLNADVPMRRVVRQEREADSDGRPVMLDALECGHRVLHHGAQYVKCVACYDEEPDRRTKKEGKADG